MILQVRVHAKYLGVLVLEEKTENQKVSFLVCIIFRSCVFGDRYLLTGPSWPGACCVAQLDLDLEQSSCHHLLATEITSMSHHH